MTDLVLSVVKDRTWQDIDCYARSLVQSGFQGRKVMLMDGVPAEAQNNLRALGFEVVPIQTPNNGLHFQTTRYFPATEFLKRHNNEFRFVFWTDVCDLVFQTNPSVWLEENIDNHDLVAVKEGWLIKNQPINDIWIQKILPDSEYRLLREEEVLCSGTIQGKSNAMLALFDKMCERFVNIDGMQGIDQGVFNHVVQTSPFKERTLVPEPEDGFVTTCGLFLAKGNDPKDWTITPPIFDRATGLVKTLSGKTFAIAHQYNRNYGIFDPNGDWRNIVERRYRG